MSTASASAAASRELWASASPRDWDVMWTQYGDVLASLKKENLVELDDWFRKTLRSALRARDPAPFITQAELVKLMEWKLKKGKWRPQLMKYVTNLSPNAVKKASAAAFAAHRSKAGLKPAIEALTVLKGIGPATASAVLAAYDDNVPFMGDEALDALALVIGERQYTLRHYLRYAEKMICHTEWLRASAPSSTSKSKEDAEEDTEEDEWTPQRVQLCLYTAAHGGVVTHEPVTSGAAPVSAKPKRNAEAMTTTSPSRSKPKLGKGAKKAQEGDGDSEEEEEAEEQEPPRTRRRMTRNSSGGRDN